MGSGGWGFESLAARQTWRSGPIKQEKLWWPMLAVVVLACAAPNGQLATPKIDQPIHVRSNHPFGVTTPHPRQRQDGLDR